MNKPQGEPMIRTLAMPKDTNYNGDIFGGWLMSQMDLACSILAKRRAKSRTATVAVNAMNFITPVHVGDTVSCYAELLKVGRTSMTIKVEVWRETLDGDVNVKVTEGVFVFVAIDEHNRPQPVDRPD